MPKKLCPLAPAGGVKFSERLDGVHVFLGLLLKVSSEEKGRSRGEPLGFIHEGAEVLVEV